MRITKTLAAIALLLAPTGAVMGAHMSEDTTSVEHHTTYVEIVVEKEDKKESPLGYGAVAGLVHCPPQNQFDNAVLWFNDQILFRHGKQGPQSDCLLHNDATHVWLTEENAPDPRDNPSLQPTNVTFEFTDPNGMDWIVNEYKYHVFYADREESTTVGASDVSAEAHADAQLRKVPFYTWVVEIQEETVDPTIKEPYNFVNVVDFEKLQLGPDGHEEHDGEAGDPKKGNSHDADDPGEEHAFPHKHHTAEVRTWVGEEPEPGTPAQDGTNANIVVVPPDQVDGPSFTRGPVTVE